MVTQASLQEETVNKENSHKGDSDKEPMLLSLSTEQVAKIKAGAFYNGYDSLEEFVVDTVIDGVEADKQRHLKSKQSNKIR